MTSKYQEHTRDGVDQGWVVDGEPVPLDEAEFAAKQMIKCERLSETRDPVEIERKLLNGG